MKGNFYGVGVGPGDEKLLTILAVETLENADVIVVPDSGGERTALGVVKKYINHKVLMYCDTPMTRDEAILKKSYMKNVQMIHKKLDEGLNLAFITLGDPTIYSTYMYIHRILVQRGYSAKIINGVPSFCAAAAKLGVSLCDGKDALHIIPASYEGVDELLALDGNKVLMKSGKNILNIKDKLKKYNLLEKAKMIECCFMENEMIYEDIESLSENSSYFSIIIVKGD